MERWPHQTYGIDETRRLIELGERRIALTSPTGGGKSVIMLDMCRWGWPTLVCANRVMLVEQLFGHLDRAGIDYGIHASGYAPSIMPNVQVASIQTLYSRWKAGDVELPHAKLILIDEVHNEKGRRTQELVQEYIARGAAIVGITATPLGIDHLFTKLVTAGTTSELRACGALVPANTYAPDEPAMENFKPKTRGILQLKDEVKHILLPVIFGRVLEHFNRLNKDRKPSILFAPGVPESQWFAEQFFEAGITAAHIDSQRIWINGETLSASRENRESLRRASESGQVCIICNRFVMREGVDYPWLAHGIFACTFGSLCSYIQAGGRLLRAHSSLSEVAIQDHGGNYWRHDSLNCDREWSLTKTEQQMEGERAERFRTKAEQEPIVCPACKSVRRGGVSCKKCGFTYKGHKRVVIQTDGQLREVHGDIYKPRRVSNDPELHKAWKACVFRCMNSGRTFNQARALFMRENNWAEPGPEFPMMPKDAADWYLKVSDVYQRKAKA